MPGDGMDEVSVFACRYVYTLKYKARSVYKVLSH